MMMLKRNLIDAAKTAEAVRTMARIG